jgi:hypothetical protein
MFITFTSTTTNQHPHTTYCVVQDSRTSFLNIFLFDLSGALACRTRKRALKSHFSYAMPFQGLPTWTSRPRPPDPGISLIYLAFEPYTWHFMPSYPSTSLLAFLSYTWHFMPSYPSTLLLAFLSYTWRFKHIPDISCQAILRPHSWHFSHTPGIPCKAILSSTIAVRWFHGKQFPFASVPGGMFRHSSCTRMVHRS